MTVADKSLLQKVLHRGLVENKHDLEIERRNPKSPLYSVKSFEALNLKPELLKVSLLMLAATIQMILLSSTFLLFLRSYLGPTSEFYFDG